MTFSLSVFFSLKVMAHLPRKTEVRSAFYKFNFFLMKDVLEKIFVLFYKWVRSRYFFWRMLFTTLYLAFFLDDFWYCKIILIGYTSRFRTVQDYQLCSQKTGNLWVNHLAIFILCFYWVNLFSQKLDDRIFHIEVG